jgi:hypothetical protein
VRAVGDVIRGGASDGLFISFFFIFSLASGVFVAVEEQGSVYLRALRMLFADER